MTAWNLISYDNLWRLIGSPTCPVIVDGRTEEDFAVDPRILPAAVCRPGLEVAAWAQDFAGRRLVVYCQRGLKISQGAAAWLRQAGTPAEALAGGIEAWRDAGLPLVPVSALPPRNSLGRTCWVAAGDFGCAVLASVWLIRRFVDPEAVLLFVEPSEVAKVSERFGAGVLGQLRALSDRLGLTTAALTRFAAVVEGAPDVERAQSPESAGFRAAWQGLCALHADDLVRLEEGLVLCDAFYAWARERGDRSIEGDGEMAA